MFNQEDEALRKLREDWPKMSREDKIDAFLWKMVWYHHNKHVSGSPSQPINELTETLKKASKDSEKLTNSIRTATWVAAIVGGFALIVSVLNLLREL